MMNTARTYDSGVTMIPLKLHRLFDQAVRNALKGRPINRTAIAVVIALGILAAAAAVLLFSQVYPAALSITDPQMQHHATRMVSGLGLGSILAACGSAYLAPLLMELRNTPATGESTGDQ